MIIKGLHHITAISGNPHENFRFYTQVLGLRLVKKTVNFDDPGTYHLYYGDYQGSPGSLLTFFPYEGRPGRPGTGQVVSTTYAVAQGGLEQWQTRLKEAKWSFQTDERFGHEALLLSDPHGMQLEIVEDSAQTEIALGKFSGATLSVGRAAPTRKLLEVLGFTVEQEQGERTRMRLADGDFLDLLEQPDAPRHQSGPGSVHHIALRVADGDEQLAWRDKLISLGYQVSPVMDRNYFESIYFRGPGGVLFELATDPPGMTVDEPLEKLGEELKLPEQYERHRATLIKQLAPLEKPYHALEASGQGATIVALHGTGGDEHDLLGLVSQLAPDNPVLSLRGNVSESGMNRFFRRLSAGVFDQDDLKKRTDELASFLLARQESRIAVGYSNGANMAAATLMAEPKSFDKAVLLRPMLGWTPDESVDLVGKEILLLIGAQDRMVSPDSGRQLAELFRQQGAAVEVRVLDSGHSLTREDIEIAGQWLGLSQERAA